MLGTAAYMSPEQAEGRDVDARSDVFSFGAMLYEMATGRRAFRGESAISTLSAVLTRRSAADGRAGAAGFREDRRPAACARTRRGGSRAWPTCASCWRTSRRTCGRGGAEAALWRSRRLMWGAAAVLAAPSRRRRMVASRTPGGAGAAGQGDAARHVSGREGLPGDFARRQRGRVLVAQAGHRQLRSVRASGGRWPARAADDQPGRRLFRLVVAGWTHDRVRPRHRVRRQRESSPSRRSAVASSASRHGAAPFSGPRGRQTAGT